jgi:5'-nucleotidase
MGRETKILLALLATLAGVFVGVLSMKLLVPRPPTGAGPDVAIDTVTTGAIELVDPPSPSPPTPGPTTAEPAGFTAADSPAPYRSSESRFTAAESGDLLPPPTPLTVPDAETPPAAPPATAAVDFQASAPPAAPPAAPAVPSTPRRDPFVAPAGLQMPAPQPEPATGPAPTALEYVTNPGDSWWDLAERAYGDGRLYRALFAWNRTIDPRISLTPGTRLEIPPRSKLEAAWPKLMPAE